MKKEIIQYSFAFPSSVYLFDSKMRTILKSPPIEKRKAGVTSDTQQ